MGAIKNIGHNFGKAFSGQSLVTLFSIGTLAINTRALGAHDFGVLVVLQSTSELVAMVFAFQTWQAIVRFGAMDLAAGDIGRLRERFWFGFKLDLAAAVVAALVTAGAALCWSGLFHLPQDRRLLGLVFAAGLVCGGTSASVGLLRVTGHFGRTFVIQVVGAAALCANAVLLAALHAPFPAYVISIAAILAATSLATIVTALLKIRKLESDRTREGIGRPTFDHKEFFRFSLATSASGTLNAVRQRGEALVVAALLGPAAAGLYAVAYRTASLLDRFAEAGRQSVYPEIAALVARGDQARARSVVAKISMLAATIGIPTFILTVLFGGWAVGLAFGDEYSAAHVNVIWLMMSSLIFASTFPLAVFIQVVHGAGRFLVLNAIASLFFLMGAVGGPLLLGTAGAGLGAALFAPALLLLLLVQCFSKPLRETAWAVRIA